VIQKAPCRETYQSAPELHADAAARAARTDPGRCPVADASLQSNERAEPDDNLGLRLEENVS
jgi:hypothetical protein